MSRVGKKAPCKSLDHSFSVMSDKVPGKAPCKSLDHFFSVMTDKVPGNGAIGSSTRKENGSEVRLCSSAKLPTIHPHHYYLCYQQRQNVCFVQRTPFGRDSVFGKQTRVSVFATDSMLTLAVWREAMLLLPG